MDDGFYTGKEKIAELDGTIPKTNLEVKKQINWKLITIVLAVVLLSLGGVYAYQQLQEKAYEQGIQDANIFLNQQIQQQLETQGYVIYNYPINETTARALRLGVMQE